MRNLFGVEWLCAALGVVFDADVWVGIIHAIEARKSSLPAGIRSSVAGQTESAAVSHDPALSGSTATSIRLEYDDSGEISISISEHGGTVREYS